MKLTGAVWSGLQRNGDSISAQPLREWAKINGHTVNELQGGEVEIVCQLEGEYELDEDGVARKISEGDK